MSKNCFDGVKIEKTALIAACERYWKRDDLKLFVDQATNDHDIYQINEAVSEARTNFVWSGFRLVNRNTGQVFDYVTSPVGLSTKRRIEKWRMWSSL